MQLQSQRRPLLAGLRAHGLAEAARGGGAGTLCDRLLPRSEAEGAAYQSDVSAGSGWRVCPMCLAREYCTVQGG